MTDVRQDLMARFNAKHDLTEDSQFKQLVEELGELSEAYNRDQTDVIAEELADVIFVARSLAEMRDINVTECVNDVAAENIQKDESTDGDKVTKSGVDGCDDEFHISEWDSYTYDGRRTFVDGEIPSDFDQYEYSPAEGEPWEVENVCVDVMFGFGWKKVCLYGPGKEPWTAVGEDFVANADEDEDLEDVATELVREYRGENA